LFQPLDVIRLKVSWFKTLEHSTSYSISHWPGEKRGKMRFQKPCNTVCLQQHKFLMTFKALLYKCYAGRGPIGAESKGHGRGRVLWNFLAPLANLEPSGTWS